MIYSASVRPSSWFGGASDVVFVLLGTSSETNLPRIGSALNVDYFSPRSAEINLGVLGSSMFAEREQYREAVYVAASLSHMRQRACRTCGS